MPPPPPNIVYFRPFKYIITILILKISRQIWGIYLTRGKDFGKYWLLGRIVEGFR